MRNGSAVPISEIQIDVFVFKKDHIHIRIFCHHLKIFLEQFPFLRVTVKVKIGPGSPGFLSYWCNSQDADGMEREKKEEKIREEKREKRLGKENR